MGGSVQCREFLGVSLWASLKTLKATEKTNVEVCTMYC